ncbi:hypothetical protein FH972_021832 [Carpinus fangiana]|uniref:Lunapark zinc ribbon domain-containing protein n=1 Tax=Carpinus fangiana TaxID=176857 RepID=A0A5N6KQT9_9ROSI|nr:hypothetical protein FH972_021832 [Carpinus fangiana]
MAVLAGKFLRAHNVPRCLLTKLLQRSASPTSSFEKTLSTLADRISKTTAHRDALLSSRRRWKVLWTLYTTFAYLLFSVILVLVTGRAYWSYAEYGAVAGGPIVIYLVRLALSYLFDLRVNRAQATLDDLFKQRQTAIDKFKKETQYDSTQKLLEKYGAEKPKTAPKTPGEKPKAPRKQQNGQMPQRTGLPPPPTANIQRPLPPLPPGAVPHPQQIPPMALNPKSAPIHDTTAEFAPNAFPGGSVPPRAPGDGPHIPERQWYDRLMDVLLGDDETKPGSRLALVCANPQCRLVNGQAPPGVKSLSETKKVETQVSRSC